MADEIRTPPEFLSALQSIVDAVHGGAMLDALGVELARRREMRASPPEPWTLATVLDDLGAKPHATSLFGAMRLLQGAQPDKAMIGYSRRAEDDAVRVDQTLLLGFAASEVDAITQVGQTRPRLRQSAVGLLGPNGALPFRWTEHAHDLANTEYRSQRDVSFLAWLNVMQRRQIALLYRAWSDAQAVTGADRPAQTHPIADRLRALGGVLLHGLRDRDGIDDGFKMAFSAALSRRVRNPGPLASMLSLYFEAPVRIEEFAAHWLEIPVDQRSSLGRRFTTLGDNSVAGFRVWDSTTRFRIVIGPLTLEAYRRFLPNGEDYAKLRDMVSLYVGVEHEWELVPVLKRQDVPYSWAGNPGLLLGWSAWLGVRYDDVDARDLVLPMTPRLGPATMAPAPAEASHRADHD